MKQKPKQDIEIFIDGITNPAEPNQALKDAAERLKGKELFKESNDRARKTLSEIKSLPIQKTLEKYSERFDNDKSPIGNPETWGKRVLTEEDIFNQRDIDAVTDYIGKETSKQETLEEAGDRELSYINDVFSNNIDFVSGFRIGMLLGAKWQQERSYSEEEVEDLIYKVCGTVARLQGIILNGNHLDTAYKQYKKK
jgi:ribosomal protein S6